MPRFVIHHEHHHRPSQDQLNAALQPIKDQLMAISKEVQALLDQARQLPNFVTAMNAGFAALGKQGSDLQAQISASQGLSDDDKTALTEATADISDTIAALPANITAGTNVDAGQAPSTDVGAQGTQSAPGTSPAA